MHNSIQIRYQFVSLMACVLGMVISCGCLAQQTPVAGPVKQNEQTSKSDASQKKANASQPKQQVKRKVETAIFGAGCFWCVEAVFQELDGVLSVKSGFTGGHKANPTYDEVCDGKTGHAETCMIKFDANKISYKELLEVFWKTHDPTTLNRQGADKGTWYRSAVFYLSEDQKELATKYKKKLDASGAFPNPIVTEITKASAFYAAENYHDNYYKQNQNAGYCQAVIRPKMDKFRAAFSDKLKSAK